MRRLGDWAGPDVLDLGCGTGFHLPRWARAARRSVVGVEPHARPGGARPPAYRAGCERRPCSRARRSALPLPDAIVDVVQARWAYFFGPGCEPGLPELSTGWCGAGGTAFVVDNDATRSHLRRLVPPRLPRRSTRSAVERFWSAHGLAAREPVDIVWRFATREPSWSPSCASSSTRRRRRGGARRAPRAPTVDYAVNLWWRRF